MTSKTILPLAATLTLLLGASSLALAQQTSATDLKEIEDDDTVVQPFGRTADEIEDMDVVGSDDEDIGEVEAVLVDASGQPVAIVVETDELLDLDDEEVVVPLDQLQLVDDRLVTDLSKDAIEKLPAWDD